MMNRIMNLPEPLLPGIPSAPKGKRFVTAAEIDYQRRKRQLANRLPALRPEDLVGTLEQPFYQELLRDLMASGNSKAADEINNLLRKEERDRKTSQIKSRMSPVKLIDQPELLTRIADTLKLEQTLLHEGKKESAMLICKQLADSFLLQDKSIWLARHFYLAVLNRCRKICPKTTDRLQAEIHCLLAYIARENNESLESALGTAIDHLAVCRTLSRDQNWQFKPNMILIKLKRPIAFYGITSDDVYEVVDACTMSLYNIASLLEHELLISLANQIMHAPHHKAPTDEDLRNAHEFADLALQLALEVRQPVALSSALTRFGIVLRHVGAFDDAMKYFQQLQHHASSIGDTATEAIAFHNMGLCYIGMLNSVEALNCFAKQKELASFIVTKELEGNAMHEIGHLLLQEGHLWEAEESYLYAFECYYFAREFRKSLNEHSKSITGHHETVDRAEIAWGMVGVAAGQANWSRLAGLCRSSQPRDLQSVLQFKFGRKPLNTVRRPDYAVQDVANIPKPWATPLSSLASNVVDDQKGEEASWEEGFFFATDKPTRRKSKRSGKKVGFFKENEVAEGEDAFESDAPRVSMEEALKTLKELTTEIKDEATHGHADYSSRRASELMEKEKQRRSLAMEARRSSAMAAARLDRRPTLGSEGAVGNEEQRKSESVPNADASTEVPVADTAKTEGEGTTPASTPAPDENV